MEKTADATGTNGERDGTGTGWNWNCSDRNTLLSLAASDRTQDYMYRVRPCALPTSDRVRGSESEAETAETEARG
eukprot:scaffold36553_cov124-Isochrysis_galbana.AAC.2